MVTKEFLSISILLLFTEILLYSQAPDMPDPKPVLNEHISLALGSNMDIADGVKLNSFYGRLSINQSEAIKTKSFLGGSLGIYAGLYQNRYVDNIANYPEFLYYKPATIYGPDSIKYARISTTRTETTTSNNYGLLLSIPVSYQSADSRHKYGWTFLDFEAVIRKIEVSSTFNASFSDTIILRYRVSKDSIYPENSLKSTIVDKYWGVCTLHYEYTGDKYTAFIKAIPFGLKWNDEDFVLHPFYNFYFGLTETELGIRIGGEFKGQFGRKSPFFNLFITKKINLSEVGKALKSS